MDDTPPHIKKKMREMFEKVSPEERVRMTYSMHDTSKQLIIRAILERNPNISKKELRKEVFLKFYGSDFDEISRQKILDHFDRLED